MKRNVGIILLFPIGILTGILGMIKFTKEKVYQERQFSEKHLALFLMMNQWVKVKQSGKNLSSYFEKKGYKNIAIYGMNHVGRTLWEELKDTQVEVIYGIDQDADRIDLDMDVVSADGPLKGVDAVVVTAITFFNEIQEKLGEQLECPIVSLEDVLYELDMEKFVNQNVTENQ